MDKEELKHKEIIQILDAQFKAVQVSMFAEKSNKDQIAQAAAELVAQGYAVQKICCGECDQDDILIIIHTCNPHRFTHTCKSKREEQEELAEVKKKVKRKLFPSKEK